MALAKARLCLLFLVLFVLFQTAALASPPRRLVLIPPPALRVQDDLLMTDLAVSVDNEEGLRDLLKNGAVLELGLTITVVRLRSILSNKQVEKRQYSSIIRHDPLSRDFLVAIPEAEGKREVKDRNISRLLNASWKKLSLPATSLRLLREQGEDEEFEVEIQISLRHTDVPPWLQKSIAFWESEVAPDEKTLLPFVLPNK
ncbi:MAG: DUF4390 domain-containing protein [Desulfovibrio sp.]|nr:DUF4390 domain-containing protein [Desulfovibrio sp.]